MTMAELVEVIQADREAAADTIKAYRDRRSGDWQGRVRRGEADDGEMVQAFARHRIATRPAIDQIEAMLATYKAALFDTQTEPEGSEARQNLCSALNDARDALDWKARVNLPALLACARAGEALLAKLDAITEHGGLAATFAFAAAHGFTYDGPRYGEDEQALREALQMLESPK